MLNYTPSFGPPKVLRSMQFYMPFFFSLFPCGIVVLIGMFPRLGITMQAAYPAFFFLPMAFLFVATSTQNEVARLEKRIDDLEAKLSNAKKV